MSFFLAGNYTDDIIACALSDSPPLAIAGTEVLDYISSAGLAAPTHVLVPVTFLIAVVPNARGS